MRITVTVHIEPDDPRAHDHIEIMRCADGTAGDIAATAVQAAEMAAAASEASRATA